MESKSSLQGDKDIEQHPLYAEAHHAYHERMGIILDGRKQTALDEKEEALTALKTVLDGNCTKSDRSSLIMHIIKNP